jgi:hypothetical protein
MLTAAMTNSHENAGEPWRFGIRPEHAPEFLRALGLTLSKDFGAAELAANYLNPIGRPGALTGFTHGAVAGMSADIVPGIM